MAKGEMKGWFKLPDREGDRTLDQQLLGLDPLFAEIKGKTVLDVGCAEGLVSIELAKAGAASTLGVEILPRHLPFANRLKGDLPCEFVQGDADYYEPAGQYDVVLMLAILHKLEHPTKAAEKFADCARELVVIRLPPNANGVVQDARSGMTTHYITRALTRRGFTFEGKTLGPFNEWCGWYRRTA